MNLQELKDKILKKLDYYCMLTESASNSITEIFSEFEQSNKENQASESRDVQFIINPKQMALNETFKKQIESLQKEIEAMKSKKDESETKQERFYYQVYVQRIDVVPHGYKYEIKDRKNIFISEHIYTEGQAIEVCLFLNSLAKGE